nr:protein plastid movement impaired 1-related 1-like [Tanacetum cinerariifolium]
MSYVYYMSSPGYLVVGNSSPGMVKSPAKAPGQSHIKRGDNLSVLSRSFGRSVDDVKDLHEVLPILKLELSESQEPVVGQFAADHSDKQTYGRRTQRYDIREPDPEYVSLEDLAPLAMNKIEALSIEGLRIQVNFDGSLGLEGTEGLQLLDVKNSSAGHEDDDDGIMENDEIKVEEKLVPVETKEAFIEEEISVKESVLVPQFKITEVHVAGVKTESVPSKKPLWGSSTKQQQAGSRWLVANGMGKKNAKHPLM